MAREDYEVYKAIHQDRSQQGAVRRAAGSESYETARQMAAHAGMTLRKHTEAHYGLECPTGGWLLNIYPGNRRLYHDRQRRKPPFLKLKPDWTLLDVVHSAIEASGNMDAFAKEITNNVPVVTDEHVQVRAYHLWEAAGRPQGDGQDFWQQAERELRGK